MISKCTTVAQLVTAFMVMLMLGFELSAIRPLLIYLFWLTTALTTASGLHYVVLGIMIINKDPQG
jgi:hypothetical protein